MFSIIHRCGLAAGATILALALQAQAAVIFSEDMGSAATTTQIADHTFQNSGTLSYSGTGDVRNTTPSTGYAGASGLGNIFLNTGGRNFLISSIDTTGYIPGTLDLSFGAHKSTAASDMSELQLHYSTDGTLFLPLAIPAQPTGTGTANWRLVSLEDTTIPISSSLTLRWTNSAASGPQFRIDDVTLSGTVIPEPAALGMLGLAGVTLIRRRR
jgi:MYXO-CTERM domain-containing protein